MPAPRRAALAPTSSADCLRRGARRLNFAGRGQGDSAAPSSISRGAGYWRGERSSRCLADGNSPRGCFCQQLYRGEVIMSQSLGACDNATPNGFEPLRAEPNGFLAHFLSHSDTVSCVLRPDGDRQMRGCRHSTQQARPRLWVMSQSREPPRRSARSGAQRQSPPGSRRGSALLPRKKLAGFNSDGQCEISVFLSKMSGRRA